MQGNWEHSVTGEMMELMGSVRGMMGMGPPSPQETKKLMTKSPSLIKRIKKKDPSTFGDQFKMMAVQFFIQYYTMRMFSLAPLPTPEDQQRAQQQGKPLDIPQPDQEQLELFKADQSRDMEFAWQMLCEPFKSKEIGQQAVLMKIEIGQRLESCEKLAAALDGIKPTGIPQMDMQINMVAFTAAPLIGRFKSFMQMGAMLPPQAMEQYSEISAQMPVPDYSVLYQLCQEEKANELPVPDPKSLPWDTKHVSKIRVKFKDLNCGKFEKKKAELLKEIQDDESNLKWEDVPNPNQVSIRRMGCVWQAISFAESPQQLCGIYSEDKIHVKGKSKAFMGPPDIDPQAIMMGQAQVSPDQIQIVIQEEEWDLKRSEENPNLFIGIYKMANYQQSKKPITDPEKAPLFMEFDVEMTFCTKEEYENLQNSGKIQMEATPEKVEKIITDFDELELD